MWLIDPRILKTEQRETLERSVLRLGSLQEVVRWGFSLEPPSDVAAVVIQDEFSHDVVMPWRDGTYLVFDTT